MQLFKNKHKNAQKFLKYLYGKQALRFRRVNRCHKMLRLLPLYEKKQLKCKNDVNTIWQYLVTEYNMANNSLLGVVVACVVVVAVLVLLMLMPATNVRYLLLACLHIV